MDFELIRREIREGYINEQIHPAGKLRILNYTPKTQYDWHWNEATMNCRGLIVDEHENIVARPFQKFFSYEQLEGELPDEPFEVFEKMDGSLGILYWFDGQPAIATRGSFAGPQALKATEILRQKYHTISFDPSLTYLFEIIYPDNRVVVDYGDQEDLVLLAVIKTSTGIEMPVPELEMPVAQKLDGLTDFAEILSLNVHNREGFVVRFESGQRVKVKFEEYKRLHKLITGVSASDIWELLSRGESIDSFVERVPDEFYDWVHGQVQTLQDQFDQIKDSALALIDSLKSQKVNSRREIAEFFKRQEYPSVLFAMLDEKEWKQVIWRLVKPTNCERFASKGLSPYSLSNRESSS